ncbi:MAG: response regulator transcription factor [Balneolaceae bacterium]|nr:response regulator transcription factor [Balneolaceae bacterium]
MKQSCFIIDDEPLAIEVIESHIEKLDSIEIKGTFQNAIKAFQALKDTPVDLLFLDIQMPRLSGIEFLKTLKNPPLVIFTTAYREYALEGFELDVVDYLLKPISFERFLKAIDKVMSQRKAPSPEKISNGDSDSEANYLFVPVNKKYIKICLEEILYVESKRDYVLIKTESKEVKTNQTITYMEERLPSEDYLRVHRSFIVNLKKMEGWSHTEVDLPGLQIPIGRTYKNHTLKVLKQRSEVI